jgi:hypothetical protein
MAYSLTASETVIFLPSEGQMPGPGYMVGRLVKYILLPTLLMLARNASSRPVQKFQRLW